jgi:hypothetical protein
VNIVAAIGLALGGVFGLVGTLLTQRSLQAASCGIDFVGLVPPLCLRLRDHGISSNQLWFVEKTWQESLPVRCSHLARSQYPGEVARRR